jgi:hypothetical protein
MTAAEFDRKLSELLHQEPFRPFVVVRSQGNIEITDPDSVAYRNGFALKAKADLNDDRFYCQEVSRFEIVPDNAELKN